MRCLFQRTKGCAQVHKPKPVTPPSSRARTASPKSSRSPMSISRMNLGARPRSYSPKTRRLGSRPTWRIKAKIKQIVRSSLRTWSLSAPPWEDLTMTPEDYFTNAVRMFLADGAGTPESAHRLIDETATEPARAKPSRDEVAGAPLPSPATSEEIARAVREAFAERPKIRMRQR